MTNDDIKKMALSAGFGPTVADLWEPSIQRFARLVAAHIAEQIGDSLIDAMQADLGNGVKWLNEEAARKFRDQYPELSKAIARANGVDDANGR